MRKNKSPPPGTLVTRLYILDAEGIPVNEPDFFKWASWMCMERTSNRILQRDELTNGVCVFTVFLGMDHRIHLDNGLPILWETTIFGGPPDLYQERYTSRDDALAGHQRAAESARKSVPRS